MGELQRWLFDGDHLYSDTSCCPDPDPDQFNPEIDAMVSHGYDPDFTPVDTLMAGPVGMHLQHAENLHRTNV